MTRVSRPPGSQTLLSGMGSCGAWRIAPPLQVAKADACAKALLIKAAHDVLAQVLQGLSVHSLYLCPPLVAPGYCTVLRLQSCMRHEMRSPVMLSHDMPRLT